MGARLTKWMRNGCARPAPSYRFLQKALRPKPDHWIDDWLSLENPTCHRKANRRITQMHHLHKTPPDPVGWFASGEEHQSLRAQ
jgi:hypothetical protein